MYTCTKCGEEKSFDSFYKRGDKKGKGIQSHCKECVKVKQKEWYQNNTKHAQTYWAKYWRANREWMNRLNLKWQKSNPLKVYVSNRKYRELQKMQGIKKKYSPIRHRISTWKRREREFNAYADGSITPESLKTLPQYCEYCGNKENLTIDHIVPLCKKGANVLDNLATACRSCNCSKGDKQLITWLTYRRAYNEL